MCSESLAQLDKLYLNRHEKELFSDWKKQGNKIIGFLETYVPEEVIYAAHILPIRILGTLERPSHTQLTTSCCPFMRSCFDLALQGKYDYIDGIVAADTCDTASRFFHLWQDNISLPYSHHICLPHDRPSERVYNFFNRETAKFKQSLEKYFEKDITDESLWDAIKVYNKNRTLLKKVYELRKSDPPLIKGSEAIEAAITSMITPKDHHNKLLQEILDNTVNRNELPSKGPRLLITGSIVDYIELFKLVEDCGGNVVADDLSSGSRYFWNEVDTSISNPLYAISKRYIDKIPSPYMHHYWDRFDHIKNLIDWYNVDGVIIHNLKFCTPHLAEYPFLRRKILDLGIPVVRIEEDHNFASIGRQKAIIETFIDKLKRDAGRNLKAV